MNYTALKSARTRLSLAEDEFKSAEQAAINETIRGGRKTWNEAYALFQDQQNQVKAFLTPIQVRMGVKYTEELGEYPSLSDVQKWADDLYHLLRELEEASGSVYSPDDPFGIAEAARLSAVFGGQWKWDFEDRQMLQVCR